MGRRNLQHPTAIRKEGQALQCNICIVLEGGSFEDSIALAYGRCLGCDIYLYETDKGERSGDVSHASKHDDINDFRDGGSRVSHIRLTNFNK